jgi:sporulation protein YlmC with PRC-barrel domain
MDLVRDVLDEQLVDSAGRKVGKVDGIVLRLRPDAPPLVTAIEIGGGTAARRMPRLFRRWFESLARRWAPHGEEPYRVPWDKVDFSGDDIRIAMDAARSKLTLGERDAERVVARIPGSGAPS